MDTFNAGTIFWLGSSNIAVVQITSKVLQSLAITCYVVLSKHEQLISHMKLNCTLKAKKKKKRNLALLLQKTKYHPQKPQNATRSFLFSSSISAKKHIFRMVSNFYLRKKDSISAFNCYFFLLAHRTATSTASREDLPAGQWTDWTKLSGAVGHRSSISRKREERQLEQYICCRLVSIVMAHLLFPSCSILSPSSLCKCKCYAIAKVCMHR